MASKQQIVIVEGVDMCGKSNIIAELSKLTGIPSYKSSNEHATYLGNTCSFLDQFRHTDPRTLDLVKQLKCSVLFDRAYPSEWVYSRVLGRKTDMGLLAMLDIGWADLGAKVVICRRSDYQGIVDDLDPKLNSERLQALDDVYMRFAEWTRCPVLKLNVDDENLDRETDEIMEFMGYDACSRLTILSQALELYT